MSSITIPRKNALKENHYIIIHFLKISAQGKTSKAAREDRQTHCISKKNDWNKNRLHTRNCVI